MLSLIPLLALAFSILKGFGVQNRLEPILIQQFAGASQEVVSLIIQYVDNTNVGSLGAIGLVALLFTVISVLGKIEESFNTIWKVKKGRTLFRKFSDYFSVILLGPVFLLAAISLTTTLQSNVLFQQVISLGGGSLIGILRLGPYLIMWSAFTLIYLLIPNTRVSFRPALAGGILGGTLWQWAQWGYIHFQVGMAKYNAIYGAMAQLPILLIWIYWSWVIVLLGAEVAAGYQNAVSIQGEKLATEANFASRELLTLSLMAVIASNFHYERKPWSLQQLASFLDIPAHLAKDLLLRLAEAGLVEQCAGGFGIYLPTRSLEKISVKDITDSLRLSGVDISSTNKNEVIHQVEEHLKKITGSHTTALNQASLKEVALIFSSPLTDQASK
jgi:membrane protein